MTGGKYSKRPRGGGGVSQRYRNKVSEGQGEETD